MKISIIIPTYNCGHYIKKAIDSVLGQPYQDKELIVIDGGSNDETVEILRSYGEKIKWISESDKGQADAINKGFKMASGEVATWLNADDYYESNIFEEVANEFKKDSKIVLVYGKCKSVSSEKAVLNTPQKEITAWMMIRGGNYIYQPSSFYRLEVVKKVNYLDDKLNYWMEYDLFIKLLNKGYAKYINKVLACFSVRDDQKSNLKNILAMDRELLLISKKYGGGRFSKVYFSVIFHRIKFFLKNEKNN